MLWVKKVKSNTEALALVAPLLPKNAVVVEAGAYDGGDSVHLANFWKEGHIHCFEPIPALYAKVLENTKNIKNITSYQVALADNVGFADFYVSSIDGTKGPTASSSLLAPARHLTDFAYVKFNEKIQVPTTTLDAWAERYHIDHVDFMWLDTQGSELTILKSSPRILKTVRVILTEVEFVEEYKGQALFSDIKAYLESQGFTFAAIHMSCDWCGDAVFVRS